MFCHQSGAAVLLAALRVIASGSALYIPQGKTLSQSQKLLLYRHHVPQTNRRYRCRHRHTSHHAHVTEPTSQETSSDGSGSLAPPQREKKKSHKARTSTKDNTSSGVADFLHLRRAPTRSNQPPPPRRLKLPTVAPDTWQSVQAQQ